MDPRRAGAKLAGVPNMTHGLADERRTVRGRVRDHAGNGRGSRPATRLEKGSVKMHTNAL